MGPAALHTSTFGQRRQQQSVTSTAARFAAKSPPEYHATNQERIAVVSTANIEEQLNPMN